MYFVVKDEKNLLNTKKEPIPKIDRNIAPWFLIIHGNAKE